MNDKERVDLAEWAMKHALTSGADEAAVVLESSRQECVEFRDGKLDTLADAQRNGLTIQVYVDHRYSSYSTNDLRRDELAGFIEQVVAGTRYLSPDPFRGLPGPQYYPEDLSSDLKVLDSSYDKVTTEDRVKLAQEVQTAARAAADAAGAGDKIVSVSGSCSDSHSDMVRVHSNGFLGGWRGTRFDASADVTVRDDAGNRTDDWSGSTTRFRRDLLKPAVLGQEAVRRALAKRGQTKIASGQYTCVVENRTGRRLLRLLQDAMSGRAIQQKTSFLDGMIHKPVASDKFTMIDDPALEKGLGSRLFDGEGLAAKRMAVIENGLLANYYIDYYYARKMGAEPTTGWPSNLVFSLGTRPLDAIIKDLKRGILVQGFIGGNNNSTTGDFSVGVMGFLIENGELTTPIHEMNIAGNALDLFLSLAEVGNDPYIYSSQQTPSLVFDGVHFSGI